MGPFRRLFPRRRDDRRETSAPCQPGGEVEKALSLFTSLADLSDEALRELAAIRVTEDEQSQLIGLLNGEDFSRAVKAAVLLGETRSTHGTQHLLRIAQWGSPGCGCSGTSEREFRLHCLVALIRMGDGSAVRPLRRLLRRGDLHPQAAAVCLTCGQPELERCADACCRSRGLRPSREHFWSVPGGGYPVEWGKALADRYR